MSAILLPLVMAGVAGGALLFTMEDDKRQKREMRRQIRRNQRPLTIPERCNRLTKRCHQYIDLTSLDRYDVNAKRRYLDLKLKDHVHRHLAPMLRAKAPQRAVSKRCIGICEKVCDELHIHMKPRCEAPPFPILQANYATNVFALDYNHAPPITGVGLGGRRSLM